MRFGHVITIISSTLFILSAAQNTPPEELPEPHTNENGDHKTINPQLFAELEELARVVDISYCVGVTGISKPFQCLGRCNEFPKFELITSWNTGPLMSDSCGYIALDHSPTKPRIILAFRGTYSLINTISDLSTIPQEYVPYLGDSNSTSITNEIPDRATECTNCTVHMGFLRSWHNTRSAIIPAVSLAIASYPTYQLNLVGHSLGGAVALLASLEFMARGWNPLVTTFGEPRVGNKAFVKHVDMRFKSEKSQGEPLEGMYRRVTHVDDPVPLLPPTEFGYRPHSHELYISKYALPPDVSDVWFCNGDEDELCSAGSDFTLSNIIQRIFKSKDQVHLIDTQITEAHAVEDDLYHEETKTLIPTRYKIWQILFSHRDYFWRLGVCIPGGDPWGWKGTYGPPDLKEEL